MTLSQNLVEWLFHHLPCSYLTSSSVLVKDLDHKKIVQIASGQQHSVALDSDGLVSLSSIHLILPF